MIERKRVICGQFAPIKRVVCDYFSEQEEYTRLLHSTETSVPCVSELSGASYIDHSVMLSEKGQRRKRQRQFDAGNVRKSVVAELQ